ncbi:MAG: vitamin K epoxide reductase family protein [Candidatus Thorarchaeota archaeon]
MSPALGRWRFGLIAAGSLLAIVILTVQTLDYLAGACGCGTTTPELIQAFREYGTLFGIPISLLGAVGITGVLIQTLIVGGFSSRPSIALGINPVWLQRWYLFLILQYAMMCVAIVNLIWIELFLIGALCLNCTLAQVLVVLNTGLVWTWHPEFS